MRGTVGYRAVRVAYLWLRALASAAPFLTSVSAGNRSCCLSPSQDPRIWQHSY